MKRPNESITFDAQEFGRLKRLVAEGEGQTLEFKRKASFPEKIVREMIAFANTSGGVVLIGVDDDGSIPGLKYPEEESHVIHQALKSCKPALKLRETFISVGHARSILRYDIPESTRKPHYLLQNGSKNSFVRVADQSITASREVREIAKRSQRMRNIKFHYGDHEQLLMKYLDKNPTITVKEFMHIGKLNRFYA
ncbi:MAG TPA: ATP-binding protein, partial [Cyclobacteriaceae bacterium]|nr:ATP-binding protein [Cyclobacteriaceae bacterium]